MQRWLVARRLVRTVRYLPNAVNPEFLEARQTGVRPAEASFRWVTAGRLVPLKGYPVLLRACAALRARGVRFSLDIFGDGECRGQLQAQLRALELQDCVTLRGVSGQLYRELCQYDAFVSPSLEEAFGLVVVEALAVGLPVCTTDCSGPRDILKPRSQCAIVVKTGSSEALVGGMLEMMERDSEQRGSMSRDARTLARERYSVTRIFDSWASVYRSGGTALPAGGS